MARKDNARVRYAVVGLGNIAQVAVLPAFAHAGDNSELVALVSSDAEKLRTLGKTYGVTLTGSYEDLEEVLRAGRVDAVYLAVPNSLHRSFTERIARAGVHVLCEKPMAVTEADCGAMIATTREHGVKLMVAYRLHFEAANLDVVERVRNGEIGEPRIFSSVFTHQVRPGNIRTREEMGGGALYDLGIYCVNAARYVFQAEPTEVLATQVVGRDERSAEVDEGTTAILRFPGGRIAQFTSNQGAADVSEFRIVGTKGDIRLDPAYDYAGALEETVTTGTRTITKTFAKRDQFAPEIVHFSRCIREDLDPEPSALQGLADVRIMEAMIRSSRTGQAVPVVAVPVPERPHGDLEMKMPATKKIEPFHAPSPSK